MKAKDLRLAARQQTPVAVGRSHIRGETPTALRRATVLAFDGRFARVRYSDNGTVAKITMRDIFGPWQRDFENRQPSVEKPNEKSRVRKKVIKLSEVFVHFADMGGYQRRRHEDEAFAIALAPDQHRWGTPKVSDRHTAPGPRQLGPNGERYAVIDGGARVLAMMLLGIQSFEFEVHEGLTIEQEAKYYVDLSVGQKRLSAIQQFVGRLRQGEPSHVAVNELVVTAGYRIGGHGKRSITCPRQLMHCYGLSPEALKLALWLYEPWADDHKIKGPILEGLTLFVRARGREVDLATAREKFSKMPLETLDRAAATGQNVETKAELVCNALVHAYNKGRRTKILPVDKAA